MEDWNYPLVFTNKSDLLFRKAQYLLSLDKDRAYAAVRWERFDYANICKLYWAKRRDQKMKVIGEAQLKLTCRWDRV
jgi:hypothetical protein